MDDRIPNKIARLITEDPDLINEDPAKKITDRFTRFLGWKNAKIESVKQLHDKPLPGDLVHLIKISYDKRVEASTPHWSSGSWDDEIASGLRIDRSPRTERETMTLGYQRSKVNDRYGNVYDVYGRPAQAFQSFEAMEDLGQFIDSLSRI